LLQHEAIDTDLGREQDDEMNAQFRRLKTLFWKTFDQGAATTLVASLDPALSINAKGHYLVDCQIAEPAPHARDLDVAERVWKLSGKMVGEAFDLC